MNAKTWVKPMFREWNMSMEIGMYYEEEDFPLPPVLGAEPAPIAFARAISAFASQAEVMSGAR